MKTLMQIMVGACLFLFIVLLPVRCANADHAVNSGRTFLGGGP